MSGLYEAASRGLELQLPATLFGNFRELFREVYPAHMVAAVIVSVLYRPPYLLLFVEEQTSDRL